VIDPRVAAVEMRLEGVRRLLPVTGGKGGIGKSVVASLLALVLAERGKRVGLLDLDLTGPCDHLILGIERGVPVEKFGVEPSLHDGVHFMSVSTFAGEAPAPLRGDDVSNALLEILAITQWGELDALVLDLPPGLGDMALDAVRYIPRAEYIAVSTASRVVCETVRRSLKLLSELGVTIAGVVENMQRAPSDNVRDLAADFDLPFLGAIPFDEALESASGDRARLLETTVAATLRVVGGQVLA